MTQRDEELASEMIAARLRDPAFQNRVAVARGLEVIPDELTADMANMNDVQLRAKYGPDVQRQAWRIGQGSERVRQANEERDLGTMISDTAVEAATALYRDVGNFSTWAYGRITGDAAEAARLNAAHNEIIQGMTEQNLSENIQNRKAISEAKGALTREQNELDYQAEIESGSNPTLAGWRREGRNAFDALGRLADDPGIAGAVIAQGIGSLFASAPLAGPTGLIAKGATSAVTRNVVAQRVAQTVGTSAGAGLSEVTGVYAEAVQDVMSIPTERLMKTSTVFQALLEEGMSPEDAKVQLAGMTAETAAIRQLAPSLALGFITSRFEAMPIGSFRGVGVTKGLLSIAGEGIEEAGQGITGTVNRNMSVEEFAEIGRGALEGVGEEAAIGAIAGIGTAGAAASPSAALGAARVAYDAPAMAADALLAETRYNDPLTDSIMGKRSAAFRAGEAIGAATSGAVAPAVQAASNVARKAASVVGETVAQYANRPDSKEVEDSVANVVNATETLRAAAAEGQLPEGTASVVDIPAPVTPSEGFTDVAGGERSVMENVTGIIAKLGSRGFKPTDSDIAFAADQIQKLKNVAGALPRDIQTAVGKVLSSKVVQDVATKITEMDLNKPGADTSLETVVRVATTNPANINPDVADKILEESGEKLTPEQAKYVSVASRLGRIVNRNVAKQVEIRTAENINLEKASRPKKPDLSVEGVSRQIHAEGKSDSSLKAKYRSINDFGRDILSGVQSVNRTVINQEGRVIPVEQVAQEMQQFAQHMVNKVKALNESIADGYVNAEGKRSGKLKDFEGLVNGKFVSSALGSNNLRGVRYSPSNANSVAFAQQVAQDQNDVIEAYNLLRTEFPDVFGSLPEMQPVALTPADANPNPTVSDEASTEAEEQTTAPTETQSPTVDEEVSRPSETDEKNQTIEIDGVEVTRAEADAVLNEPDNVKVDEGYITDEEDNVMTFYHGTGGPEFSQFNDSKDGIFLTTRKGQGREYAIGKENPRLMAVNVRSTNPLFVEAEDPQNHWLTKRNRVEADYKDGGHDSIIITNGTEAIVVVYNGSQIAIVNQNIDAKPAVSEGETDPVGGTDERSESVTNEGSDLSEPLDIKLPYDQIVAQMTAAEKARLGATIKERLANTRNFVKATFGPMNRSVRVIRIVPIRSTDIGHAKFANKEIRLREDLFDENNMLTAQGRAVLIHEVGHLVDNHENPDGSMPVSSARTFYKGGNVFKEMSALRGKMSKYFNDRLEYVFSRPTPEVIASEMFAVATEMAFTTEDIQGDLSETAAIMEHVYGNLIQTETTGTATDVSSEEVQESGGEPDTGTTVGEPSPTDARPIDGSIGTVTEFFTKHFTPTGKEAPIKSLEDLNKRNLNPEHIAVVRELLPEFKDKMNARLKNKVKGKSILRMIMEGAVSFKRYKAGALVNPETGVYDDFTLNMAAIALTDFIVTAAPKDPRKLDDTLEQLGLTINEVSEESLRSVLFGLPPSQVKDQLASDLLRLWNVRENKESAINNLEGISHGFAAEMLTVMDEMGLIKLDKIDLQREGEKEALTIMVDTPRLEELQKRVRNAGGERLPNTVREGIFNDRRPDYSIGKKIPTTATRQSRGDVLLSGLERQALKNMQDTPHYFSETRGQLLVLLGEEGIQRMLGYKENAQNIGHRILRKSAIGLNASIRKNILEVQEIVDAMKDDTSQPVYYPVGVTKVGRHQYQGPNPQSNKLLRMLITPTWNTLSFSNKNDMDEFWLGVAQATGTKVEKANQDQLLQTVQTDFYAKHGQAVAMVKEGLQGGTFDRDAFLDLIGEQEPQFLGALEAVAVMEIAKEEGSSDFRTSLSFELDGLTNGAANMMVNFGQGLFTAEEFENLQRIGFFLGETGRTVNSFFEGKKNRDLYETVAAVGDRILSMGGNVLKPWQKQQRIAAQRLAASIGDFELVDGQYKMTRNTAKNPMTKVNYGSGVQGVAVGVSDAMLLNFYEKLQDMPEGADVDTYFYKEMREDLKAMGLHLPKDFDNTFEFPQTQVEEFRKAIRYTIGETLTNATREVLGKRIEELNDMLVLGTNIQNKYLQKLYDKKINELAERLAGEGVIGRNSKTQTPNKGEIPRKYWDELAAELSQLAPIFTSDEQTLAIGGFEKKLTDLRLSSNFDETLGQPARMPRPDDVGVRAIPFTVIGSGDAMMMNLIFGTPGTPMDVLGIFDGLDIPVGKIKEYAPRVNEKVLQSWDRDVLGMAVTNFNSFVDRVEDVDLLKEAEKEVLEAFKKDTVQATSLENLRQQLTRRLKENQARKKVIRSLAVSVDQMGGSNVGYSREGQRLDIREINLRIERELQGKGNEQPKVDVKAPVKVLTAKAVLDNTRWTPEQKKVAEILKPLLGDTRVVFGTLDQLNQWRADNLPADSAVLKAKGQYDAHNDIMFMTVQTGETLLHEMVHAATYNKVLDHYNGNRNEAVLRLQDLMGEFLQIKGTGKILEAQAAINRRLVKNTPEANAAAVNEFMAYALANAQVRTKLKNTETGIVAGLAEKVIALLRRLMGGIPKDMFSHVVFNTRVLNEPPPPIDNGNGGNGGNNGGGGPSQTSPTGGFTNYWIENLKAYMNGLDQLRDPRYLKTSQDILRANQLIDDFRQVGMLRNNEDRATFKAIYGIVLSDMKLNSNALIGLTRVFGHIEENLDPLMFGSTPEAAQEYSAVMNSLTGTEPAHGIAVLFALSQTSAKFRGALDQVPAPTGPASVQGSLNDFLAKATAFSMNKITGSLEQAGTVPNDIMATIAQTIIDHDKDREFMVLRGVTNSLTKADEYVSGKFTEAAEGMRRIDREMKQSTRSDITKYLTSAVTYFTNYLDKPGTDLTNQAVKKVTHMGLPILSFIPLRELVSEMVGTDKQNQNVVALLDRVNAAISGMRQAYREDLPGILERQFRTAPNKEQWKSMFRTLAKTDFASVVDLGNMQSSMQLLEEQGTRRTEMQRLETEMQQLLTPDNFQDAIDKGRQLAAYMNGDTVGKLLVRNAFAIASNLNGGLVDEVVPLLDRWISLEAIDKMDSGVREETVQLWQNDPAAITAIVSYIQQLNEAEEAKPNISTAARLNGYKGYIPNEGGKNTQIVIADDDLEGSMERKGFKKLDIPYTGDTNSIYPQSYYISTVRRQGAYSQGVMQNVAMTYRGVDVNTGLSVIGDVSGYINDPAVINQIMQDQLNPAVTLQDEKEALMPVFDVDGAVVGFERALSTDVTDTFFGREENLAVMLGAWAGRQVEETLADQYNRELVDELLRVWKTRERGTDAEFTDLKSTRDPIVKEAWRLIPQSTKIYMENVFEDDGVMVPTSMLNLSVGYREASLTDMWSGKTRLPKAVQDTVKLTTEALMGRKAMRMVAAGEEALQGIVSTAKDIIVIRSLVVPIANIQSNIVQLATRGVPTKTIVKDFRRKLAEVEEYNKNRTAIIELEAKQLLVARDANQKKILQDKITVLEDLNKKMSIAPMIEAGAYKNLSEGITDLDVEISSGRIGDYMEKLSNKLPEKVADLAKVGLVSKSTKFYQVANRATQYGDFLAKSIYYDHLITQGLSKADALAKMNEEFVNFSALPGRSRSYLESVGLTWFMAFKIRITKIAMQQLRENPVRALAVNSMVDIGSPVGDNILTVIAEGRLDYATGYEMLFDAPELNPWLNLMSE